MVMMDKDKLFLVIYLNVGDIPNDDVSRLLMDYENNLDGAYDESIEKIIVPLRQGETRVECINPVLLTEEQYKETEEKVKSLRKKVEEALKTLKNE